MTSLVTRSRTAGSDHLINSPHSDLLRPGDLIAWAGLEHRVESVEDDPDMRNNLRVGIEGFKSSILVPRSRLPYILISRYEDRVNPKVALLREREVRLLADIQSMSSQFETSVTIIELNRCLATVRDDLKRKGARRAFGPEDSGVIDF
jgi:hypothetical protein